MKLLVAVIVPELFNTADGTPVPVVPKLKTLALIIPSLLIATPSCTENLSVDVIVPLLLMTVLLSKVIFLLLTVKSFPMTVFPDFTLNFPVVPLIKPFLKSLFPYNSNTLLFVMFELSSVTEVRLTTPSPLLSITVEVLKSFKVTLLNPNFCPVVSPTVTPPCPFALIVYPLPKMVVSLSVPANVPKSSVNVISLVIAIDLSFDIVSWI